MKTPKSHVREYRRRGETVAAFCVGAKVLYVILSKASLHAVQAVLVVAAHETPALVPAREIAISLKLRVEVALKALQPLVRSGLLWSETGRKGGYRLARPLSEITLLEVVEAVDGPIGSRDRTGRSAHPAATIAAGITTKLAQQIREELRGWTLADIQRMTDGKPNGRGRSSAARHRKLAAEKGD